MNTTLDVCQLIKRRRITDIFYIPILQTMRKFGNWSFTCPVKKGYIWYRNLTFNIEAQSTLASMFFKNSDFYFMMGYFLKEKRKSRLIQTLEFWGGIRIY